MEKVYIGKVRSDYKGITAGEIIYMEKHSWDCGWYWGFGYIGNRNLHCHFDGEFLKNAPYTPKEIFTDCALSEKAWWVLRDLMIQAYALKSAAEIYRHGGHQTTVKGITDMVHDTSMADRLNKDLEKVLNHIWKIVSEPDNSQNYTWTEGVA